ALRLDRQAHHIIEQRRLQALVSLLELLEQRPQARCGHIVLELRNAFRQSGALHVAIEACHLAQCELDCECPVPQRSYAVCHVGLLACRSSVRACGNAIEFGAWTAAPRTIRTIPGSDSTNAAASTATVASNLSTML